MAITREYKTIFQQVRDAASAYLSSVLKEDGRRSPLSQEFLGKAIMVVGEQRRNPKNTRYQNLAAFFEREPADIKKLGDVSKRNRYHAMARTFLYLVPTRKMLVLCHKLCSTFGFEFAPGHLMVEATTFGNDNMPRKLWRKVRLYDLLLNCADQENLNAYGFHGIFSPEILNQLFASPTWHASLDTASQSDRCGAYHVKAITRAALTVEINMEKTRINKETPRWMQERTAAQLDLATSAALNRARFHYQHHRTIHWVKHELESFKKRHPAYRPEGSKHVRNAPESAVAKLETGVVTAVNHELRSIMDISDRDIMSPIIEDLPGRLKTLKVVKLQKAVEQQYWKEHPASVIDQL